MPLVAVLVLDKIHGRSSLVIRMDGKCCAASCAKLANTTDQEVLLRQVSRTMVGFFAPQKLPRDL